MARVENAEELDEWLNDQSRSVGIALAVRAALRVLPLIGLDLRGSKEGRYYRSRVVLSTFSAASASLISVYLGPESRSFIRNSLDKRQVKKSIDKLYSVVTEEYNFVFPSAENSFASALSAYRSANRVGGVTESARNAILIASSAAEDVLSQIQFWLALQRDVDLFAHGIDAISILNFPLWGSDDQGSLVDSGFAKEWDALASHLLASNEDWEIWTEWYEARLAGDTILWPDIELLRASLFDEYCRRLTLMSDWQDDWEPSPVSINRQIKDALIERERDLQEDLGDKNREATGEQEGLKLEGLIAHVGALENLAVGARFVEHNDKLTIDPAGQETDIDAARDPITAQLQTGILRRARQFADLTCRLDNQLGWGGIHAAVTRMIDAISCDTVEIPAHLGTAYETVVEVATFLDQDNMIIADAEDKSGIDRLDPDARRQLSALVVAAAPWIRRFPTARQLDDAAGAFLARRELYEPSSVIIEANARAGVLSSDDAAILRNLVEAARRGDFQGQKAGARSIFTVKNLISVSSAIYLGAIGSIVAGSEGATMSPLARNIGHALINSEVALEELLAGEASDIRLAIAEIIRMVKSGELPPLVDTPTAALPTPPRLVRNKP